MFPLVLRREVKDDLLRDPEWVRKLEAAKTSDDVTRVFVEFYKARGYKVKEVTLNG